MACNEFQHTSLNRQEDQSHKEKNLPLRPMVFTAAAIIIIVNVTVSISRTWN